MMPPSPPIAATYQLLGAPPRLMLLLATVLSLVPAAQPATDTQ